MLIILRRNLISVYVVCLFVVVAVTNNKNNSFKFVFTAGQEKENQERNKDLGKPKGRPKYHLTVRYCQRSCGN